MNDYFAAIDQGTTSTRFMIFDKDARIVGMAMQEHEQIFPKPGWVEHDPAEILRRTEAVIKEAMETTGLRSNDIAAIGITNQRETIVAWDKTTGKAIYNAIVWQDMRVSDTVEKMIVNVGANAYREKTGLPLSPYFSGLKLTWILDNIPEARKLAEKGDLLFGNIDTFLVWHLTGGCQSGGERGIHITDVTNASRTQLMDLKTLDWDDSILAEFRIPKQMLPQIRSSSEVYGKASLKAIEGVPISGILGDQQAALFGQACFQPGSTKSTYGTGAFLLLHTGTEIVQSKHGLLTTVANKIGNQPAQYALEGAVAITGALVQWLRDNLGLISKSSDVETLAGSVPNNGGAYFVPAFSGLFAPHWRTDARGVIAGLTRFVNKGHIARAALEATAFQVREILEAMEMDSGISLKSLRVDGGMVVNDLLMQFQADILNKQVICPKVLETTALGAGYAAALAVGYYSSTDELAKNWAVAQTWEARMKDDERAKLYRSWQKAVERTFNWMDES